MRSCLCGVLCTRSDACGCARAAAHLDPVPSKARDVIRGALASGVLLVAIEQIHTGDSFWEEMGTIADGTSSGTGLDRKRLWMVAWMSGSDIPFLA